MTKLIPKKLCSIFNNSMAFISKTSPLTTFSNSRYVFTIPDIQNGERNLIIFDTLKKEESKFKLRLIYGDITDIPLAIYIIDLQNIIIISAHFVENSLHIERVQIKYDEYYAEGIEAFEYNVPWIYSGYTFYDLQNNTFIISDGTSVQCYELFLDTVYFLQPKQEHVDKIIKNVKNIASRENIYISNGKRFIFTNDFLCIILCSRSNSNLSTFFKVSIDKQKDLQIKQEEFLMNKKTKTIAKLVQKSRIQINDYTYNEKKKILWILCRYTHSQDSLMYILLTIIRSIFGFLIIFPWFSNISQFFLSILKDEYSFALLCVNLLTNEIRLVQDFTSLNFYSPPYFSPPEYISLLNTDDDTGNAILYKHKRKKKGGIYQIQNPYDIPSLKTIARNATFSQHAALNIPLKSIENIINH